MLPQRSRSRGPPVRKKGHPEDFWGAEQQFPDSHIQQMFALYIHIFQFLVQIPVKVNSYILCSRVLKTVCKGPGTIHFLTLSLSYSTLLLQLKSSQRQSTNECIWLCYNKTLFMDTNLNFLWFSDVMRYFLSFDFSQLFKNVKKKNSYSRSHTK